MYKLFVALILIVAGLGAAYLVSLNHERALGEVATSTPEALNQYSSEDGISFMYPTSYQLSSRHEGTAERSWDVLLLLPKGYVPPQGGEGPPAISVSVFDNVEKLPLEQWVRGDARSNFKLSTQGTLASTTVGGQGALTYEYSGLYESNAVAVAYNNKIFLLQVGWMTPQDQIVADFKNLLTTVQFVAGVVESNEQ